MALAPHWDNLALIHAGTVPLSYASSKEKGTPGWKRVRAHREFMANAAQREADCRRWLADAEARHAAELVTEAEATDGTWRGEWIGFPRRRAVRGRCRTWRPLHLTTYRPGRTPRPGPDHHQEQFFMDTNGKHPFLTATGQRLRQAAIEAAQEAAAHVIDNFERNRAAARTSVTSSTLADLAQDYDEADTDRQRAKLGAHIASSIPLAEAGTIRRAAEAIKLATPGIIIRATAEGMPPNEIAHGLGTTSSYVRRILRENRAFSWRLDLLDSNAGPGWQSWEAGTDVMPYSEEHNVMDELAAQIIAQGGKGAKNHVARVTIWHGPEGQADETAVYSSEFHPRAI